jgi:serine/threonine-protein kinase
MAFPKVVSMRTMPCCALVEEGEFYLVEEWIEGDTLTQKLKREGNWTEKKARELLQKILLIIAYIHQNNIIHRDIKPDNLILRGEQPVLIDFGAVKETMSCVLNSQGKSSRSIVVGTEGFMPPEQATGRPTYSSDLYSLGMTIIYLLTGKHPQDLDYDPGTGKIHWHNHCSQITENFRQILDKAINPNPHERFQSAPAMLASLESDQTAKTVPTPTVIIQDVPVASPPPVTQILPLPVEPKTGEWKKAMIIGGLIGGSILASTLVLQNTLKEKLPAPKAETVQPSPPVASPSPTPIPQPLAPPVVQAPTTSVPIPSSPTNATIVGESGSKNIRSGPGLEYRKIHIAYPGDRVQVINITANADNFPWYKIYFPKSGAQGWIAGNLLALDGQRAIQPARPSPAIAAAANATITGKSGTKNLRSGPGTQYSIAASLATGERVKILNRGQDPGGYLWYKVYHPSSGNRGWIAAQLVNID